MSTQLLNRLIPPDNLTPLPLDDTIPALLLKINQRLRLIDPAFHSALLDHGCCVALRFESVDPEQFAEFVEGDVVVDLGGRGEVVL
jgi:hypothetical protein